MPKFNQYLIENKKPIELVQELEKEKFPLSVAARSKVINRNGSNYVSGDRESYGPGNGQSSSGSSYGNSRGPREPRDPVGERWERRQRERRRDEELNRVTLFVAETALKATAVSALTTATGGLAPVIGGGAWIGGKWLESANNEFLQFLGKNVGELGSGMFSGGLFENSTVGEFARKNSIDLKKLESFFEIKGKVETGWAIAEHNRHKNEGRNYKSNCELCNL